MSVAGVAGPGAASAPALAVSIVVSAMAAAVMAAVDPAGGVDVAAPPASVGGAVSIPFLSGRVGHVGDRAVEDDGVGQRSMGEGGGGERTANQPRAVEGERRREKKERSEHRERERASAAFQAAGVNRSCYTMPETAARWMGY